MQGLEGDNIFSVSTTENDSEEGKVNKKRPRSRQPRSSTTQRFSSSIKNDNNKRTAFRVMHGSSKQRDSVKEQLTALWPQRILWEGFTVFFRRRRSTAENAKNAVLVGHTCAPPPLPRRIVRDRTDSEAAETMTWHLTGVWGSVSARVNSVSARVNIS